MKVRKIINATAFFVATIALFGCDRGELSQVKKEIRASGCKIEIPSTCEKFLAQSEYEKNQRAEYYAKSPLGDKDTSQGYFNKIKKKNAKNFCTSQDYSTALTYYESMIEMCNTHTSFGVIMKNRTESCVEPLNKAFAICGGDTNSGDFQSRCINYMYMYSKYLSECPDAENYQEKRDKFDKFVKAEQKANCKNFKYCDSNNYVSGCVTNIPLSPACDTAGKVIFTDEDNGGVFVQAEIDRQRMFPIMANPFSVVLSGMGADFSCNDVFFLKTNKQFFSGNWVKFSGLHRYIGPYKYKEGNAERTTKAFEKLNMGSKVELLCRDGFEKPKEKK